MVILLRDFWALWHKIRKYMFTVLDFPVVPEAKFASYYVRTYKYLSN
jgi:hypothetical protein